MRILCIAALVTFLDIICCSAFQSLPRPLPNLSLSRHPKVLRATVEVDGGVPLIVLNCETMKKSFRTFMFIYIMGDHPSWRADDGEDRSIKMSYPKEGVQIGTLDITMDYEAAEGQMRVRRTSGGGNREYLVAERALLDAFVNEIEVMATDATVEPANRLVSLSEGAIEEARRSLGAEKTNPIDAPKFGRSNGYNKEKLLAESEYPLKLPLLAGSAVIAGKGLTDAAITIIKVSVGFKGATLSEEFFGVPVLFIDVLCVLAGISLGAWTWKTQRSN
mmetsp:Transcript_65911/g.113303  ORF Transcript_65911/g.113303 Transcript_65911/m.113303 type:complete len:276 (-) Transcript_65911:159-986(-)